MVMRQRMRRRNAPVNSATGTATPVPGGGLEQVTRRTPDRTVTPEVELVSVVGEQQIGGLVLVGSAGRGVRRLARLLRESVEVELVGVPLAVHLRHNVLVVVVAECA